MRRNEYHGHIGRVKDDLVTVNRKEFNVARMIPKDSDFAILAHLQQDARKPFTAIAEELGLSESTVRKRVARLEKLGLLRFAAFADPLRLGFQYWVLIDLRVDLRKLVSTAERIASYPEVFFVSITTGDYNLFVAAVFRSNADLQAFIMRRLAAIGAVQRTRTVNILKLITRREPLFGDERSRRSMVRRSERRPGRPAATNHMVDPLDVRIISVLQNAGRKSFAEVAGTVGVSESTVHKRVSRLTRLGILRFETFADPLRFGLQYWAILRFRVELPRIESIAERLSAVPGVFFVGVTTGDYDIFVGAVFRSNEDLLRVLTGALPRISGVLSVFLANVLRLVKREPVPSSLLTSGDSN